MKIVFTDESLNDLLRLRDFLMQIGVVNFNRLLDEWEQGIMVLQTFPELGLPIKQSVLVRGLYIAQYCVRYRYTDETVSILRIWHHRENERDADG